MSLRSSAQMARTFGVHILELNAGLLGEDQAGDVVGGGESRSGVQQNFFLAHFHKLLDCLDSGGLGSYDQLGVEAILRDGGDGLHIVGGRFA